MNGFLSQPELSVRPMSKYEKKYVFATYLIGKHALKEETDVLVVSLSFFGFYEAILICRVFDENQGH